MSHPPVIEACVRGPKLFGLAGFHAHANLMVGDPVILAREPNNPKDSNAVAVSNIEDTPLGYVQREKAGELAGWMDRGWIFTAKVIQAAIMKRHTNAIGIKMDSLIIRCIPLKQLKAPVSMIREETFTHRIPEHINCRSRIIEKA